MHIIEEKWDEILRHVRDEHELSEISFSTWIQPLRVHEAEDSVVTVLVPTEQVGLDYVSKRYKLPIKAAIGEITGLHCEVYFVLPEDIEKTNAEKEARQLSLGAGLNPRYTFDTFVVGPNNQFAHAASLAVAESPGKMYNPLFLYSGAGLGKTHLLLAIGQEIHSRSPEKSIAYIKGDEFTNQMVKSLRENKAEEFRTKYRNVSLFLVDDIQFIAGKQGTQEEFFHTFNNIYEAGNQIVITSDRPPMEMAQLDDRLRTRFEWGLMADIQPPDLETRMAITRNKAAQLGLILSDDAVEYIATNITSNIRQLEGVIKRLTAYKEILDDVITIDSVKRAIKDVIRIGTYTPTPDIIIRETARYYSLKEEDLRGQNRSKNMTMARQVSMYLMRSLTGLSLKDIGTHYEDRNHATVLSSIRKVEQLLKNDPSMAGTVRDITSNINSV